MSSDFEWHFGDEFPEQETEEKQADQPRWRRWLPGILVFLLVAGGAYAWWRGRQENLAQAEAQVQQVARLEFRALAEGDIELYLSLQDYFDRSWYAAQEAYVDGDAFPLPLQGMTGAISTTVEGARIVGNRARVQILHTATLPSGQEASFRAVRFYRYGSDGRWLHTAAEADAGGRTIAFVAGDIEVAAFEEDAEWIDPLASDLGAEAHRFCNLASCPRDLSLELNLAANLEEAAEPDDAILPAPFLVGAPADDAALAAWTASLHEFLIDQLVAHQARPGPDDDHRGALFEQRLRAWMKAKLGLTPPFSPDRKLVQEATRSGTLLPTWRLWVMPLDHPQRALAAAQIDLMLSLIEEEQGASTVAGLVHSLGNAHRLGDLMDGAVKPSWSIFQGRYMAYLRAGTVAPAGELAAFPSYNLLIGCSEDDLAATSEIWGWRLGQPEPALLSVRPAAEGFHPVSWSPDGRRLLVESRRYQDRDLSVLTAGSTQPQQSLIPSDARLVDPYRLGVTGWSPDGERLAYHLPGGPAEQTGSRIVHVNTGEEIALEGSLVAWSPDGSTLLYGKPADAAPSAPEWAPPGRTWDFFVARQDGTSSERVGEGHNSVWSPDGEQVAYVSSAHALMIYDVSSGRKTTLLDPDQLHETLGFVPAPSSNWPRMFSLVWSPDGEWVTLGASRTGDGSPPQAAILLVRSGERVVLREEAASIYDLAWSPDGRWLRALVVRGDWYASNVVGRDGSLASSEERALATWAPRGALLAVFRPGDEGANLEILNVESGTRQTIDLPNQCQFPVWNPDWPLESHTPGQGWPP